MSMHQGKRSRHSTLGAFLALAVVTAGLLAIVVALVIAPEAPSKPLRLLNENLVFTDTREIHFALQGARGHIKWRVLGSNGEVVSAGQSEAKPKKTVVTLPHLLSTGYYSLYIRDSTDDNIRTSFGVTGREPAADSFYSVQTLTAHPNTEWWRRDFNVIEPMLANLGFTTRRDSAYWNQIEISKGRYAIPHSLRKIFREDSRTGTNLLWTAGSTNALYDQATIPSSRHAIRAYAAYINFILTEEPDIRTVEIFNEFNLNHDSRCGNSGRCYARILRIVYPYVKSRHPDVTIVAGATGGFDRQWWTQFFVSGGGNYADALSFHPYDQLPTALAGFATQLEGLAHHFVGHALPIYISEVGWSISPTGQPGNPAKTSTEEDQAFELVYSFIAPRAELNVRLVNWYNAVDYGPTDVERGFGIFRAPSELRGVEGYAPKRSAIAFYVMRRLMSGYHFVRYEKMRGANGAFASSYVFADRDGDIRRVMWRADTIATHSDAAMSLSISAPGTRTTVLNYLGLPQATKTSRSTVRLSLTRAPVYVSSFRGSPDMKTSQPDAR